MILSSPKNHGSALYVVFILCIIALSAFSASLLPIHWDEGWNLCVARTWIEKNHYGCLFDGQLTGARLSTGWLTVLFTKIGLESFGLHYISGRIFIVFQALLFLIALSSLSKDLFGRSTALLTAFLATFYWSDPRLNIFLLAGWAYAEVLLVFYLTLGFLCLLATTKRSHIAYQILLVIMAILFFSLALQTKIQARPFFFVGMLSTAPLLLYRQHRKISSIIILTALGAYLGYSNIVFLKLPYDSANTINAGSGTEGLASVLGVVLDLKLRLAVWKHTGVRAWLFLLTFSWFALQIYKEGLKGLGLQDIKTAPIAFALLMFIISWSGWYFLLSIDFPRYFAPPAILSAPFMALYVQRIWETFGKRKFFEEILTLIRSNTHLLKKAVISCGIALFFLHFLISSKNIAFFLYLSRNDNAEIYEIAHYINTQTEKDALIETYDTPMFFLLNRPFRYPPDQINVEVIRKHVDSDANPLPYDLTKIMPDYIIDGIWSRQIYNLYGRFVEQNNYEKVYETKTFRIFRKPKSS